MEPGGWLSSLSKLLLDCQLPGCFCFLGPYLLLGNLAATFQAAASPRQLVAGVAAYRCVRNVITLSSPCSLLLVAALIRAAFCYCCHSCQVISCSLF